MLKDEERGYAIFPIYFTCWSLENEIQFVAQLGEHKKTNYGF
jgi:hypothetical protein